MNENEEFDNWMNEDDDHIIKFEENINGNIFAIGSLNLNKNTGSVCFYEYQGIHLLDNVNLDKVRYAQDSDECRKNLVEILQEVHEWTV